jgi:DNA-binding SARP family transcriptional activator
VNATVSTATVGTATVGTGIGGVAIGGGAVDGLPRLQVIGQFTVRRDGVVQHATEVGSRKARTLLALLAVQRGGFVPLDQAAAALWPAGPPRCPAQNLATMVSRLRAALGPDAVLGGRAGYRLGGYVRVDLSQAADLVAWAEARMDRGEPAPALAAGRPALDILQAGGVLDDEPDAEWAEPARAGHLALLRRARHIVAEAALAVGASRAARAVSEEAVAADTFDEAAHRTLMLAYAATGEPARALAAYHRLRYSLATELGVDPAAATRALYQAVLTGSATARRQQREATTRRWTGAPAPRGTAVG